MSWRAVRNPAIVPCSPSDASNPDRRLILLLLLIQGLILTRSRRRVSRARSAVPRSSSVVCVVSGRWDSGSYVGFRCNARPFPFLLILRAPHREMHGEMHHAPPRIASPFPLIRAELGTGVIRLFRVSLFAWNDNKIPRLLGRPETRNVKSIGRVGAHESQSEMARLTENDERDFEFYANKD